MNRWLSILPILVFSGCSVGPSYTPPESAVSEHWKAAPPEISAPQVANWWEIFQDDKLTSLIEEALSKSPSLLAVAEKVEKAREFARVAKSRLFPQLDFDPAASNTPIRIHSFGSTSNPPPTLIKNQIDEYLLPLTLLYEFDFWGKYRNQYKAARLKAEAEEEAYDTALLFLTTDLACAYYQLRVQDAAIEVYREILSTRKTALDIQQSRYDSRFINHTDVSLAESDYSTVESQLYDALRKRALFENQIAVLIGTSPSSFSLQPMPITTPPPVIPASVPAIVLLKRPDLKEQEKIMASLHAEINVAYSSYFPSVDVTGGIAFLTNNFVKTMKNRWFIGGNLLEILFDAGGRTANIARRTAEFKEALATYQQKVLNAFQEVEDSLASLDWVVQEMNAIQRSVDAMQVAYIIARDRYQFGLASFLGAADQEKRKLDQELHQLQLLGSRYLYTLHLIKAIGGGWN